MPFFVKEKIKTLHLILLYIITAVSLSVVGLGEDFPAATATSFEVADIFSDNMVLQRNEPIKIYGTSSDEGKVVHAKFGDSYGYSYVKDGKWEITLASRIGSAEKKTLEIYGAPSAEYTIFENVTVGDVWLIMGQSNVEFKFGNIPEYQTIRSEITGEENLSIFYVNSADYDVATREENGAGEYRMILRNQRTWENISHPMNNNASALGVCLGLELVKKSENGLPIGIISLGFAGEELANFADPSLAKTLSGYGDKSVIYNEYIRPVANFPIKGVVWYQGEANAGYWAEYAEGFKGFVSHLRNLKGQEYKSFPFYIVELPPCFRAPEGSDNPDWQYINFGGVRCETGRIQMEIPDTYICPTSDLWSDDTYVNNLHPINKVQIAERLSGMICANEWGFDGYAHLNAPVIKKITTSDGGKTVEILFDRVSGGLEWNGIPGQGFAMINETWAILDSDIELVSEDTLIIKADEPIYDIRYGWDSDCVFGSDVTLGNAQGIPAAAFSVNLIERPVPFSAKISMALVAVIRFVLERPLLIIVGGIAVLLVFAWMVRGVMSRKRREKTDEKDLEEKTEAEGDSKQ